MYDLKFNLSQISCSCMRNVFLEVEFECFGVEAFRNLTIILKFKLEYTVRGSHPYMMHVLQLIYNLDYYLVTIDCLQS